MVKPRLRLLPMAIPSGLLQLGMPPDGPPLPLARKAS